MNTKHPLLHSMEATMTTRPYLLACLVAAAFLAFRVFKAVYRLYLHPLSKFRGPRAAAISRNWQVKLHEKGFPEKEYEKLHKAFGMCLNHHYSGFSD